MNLIELAVLTLTETGFDTRSTASVPDVLYFEGGAILGFIAVYQTPAALLHDWSAKQEAFLTRHAPLLRTHREKAWNVYSIYLASESADPREDRTLRRIEGDFHATRKLTSAGVQTRPDVRRALAPILPISTLGVSATMDPEQLLRQKLNTEEKRMLDFLRSWHSDDCLPKWLIETHTDGVK